MAGIHIDEATVLNDYFKWLKSLVNAEESHSFLSPFMSQMNSSIYTGPEFVDL